MRERVFDELLELLARVGEAGRARATGSAEACRGSWWRAGDRSGPCRRRRLSYRRPLPAPLAACEPAPISPTPTRRRRRRRPDERARARRSCKKAVARAAGARRSAGRAARRAARRRSACPSRCVDALREYRRITHPRRPAPPDAVHRQADAQRRRRAARARRSPQRSSAARSDALALHQAERWRAELIADDEAPTRFAAEHPGSRRAAPAQPGAHRAQGRRAARPSSAAAAPTASCSSSSREH